MKITHQPLSALDHLLRAYINQRWRQTEIKAKNSTSEVRISDFLDRSRFCKHQAELGERDT